jgi:hypothetical protein
MYDVYIMMDVMSSCRDDDAKEAEERRQHTTSSPNISREFLDLSRYDIHVYSIMSSSIIAASTCSSAGIIQKSLKTSLRLTADVWSRDAGASFQLFPASVLRIVDHHLHASGIIPRIKQDTIQPRVYEHDWYCVSQSVRCFPEDNLIQLSLESSACSSHIWVERVGNSSLQLGNVITANEQVLATARRVFVRRSNDKSAPFLEVERERFLSEDCTLDETAIGGYLDEQHPLPLLQRLPPPEDIFKNADDRASSVVLKVTVGAQHANFGNHADHAFLAETAVHAMTIANIPVSDGDIAVNYMREAMVGHELECIVQGNAVYVVRSSGDNEEQHQEPVLVLIAKAANNSQH